MKIDPTTQHRLPFSALVAALFGSDGAQLTIKAALAISSRIGL